MWMTWISFNGGDKRWNVLRKVILWTWKNLQFYKKQGEIKERLYHFHCKNGHGGDLISIKFESSGPPTFAAHPNKRKRVSRTKPSLMVRWMWHWKKSVRCAMERHLMRSVLYLSSIHEPESSLSRVRRAAASISIPESSVSTGVAMEAIKWFHKRKLLLLMR